MSKELTLSAVGSYLESLVPPRPPELQAMEDYGKQAGFPIIGPTAGHLCYQLARIIQARQIFELGSGYGYSTAWFAKAVRENGVGAVHHVVWDEDLSQRARQHMQALGYADIVQFHVGEAVATLSDQDGPFDLIFNDIDKEGYPGSLRIIAKKLKIGGLLIVDNMIWSGKVWDQKQRDLKTEAIRELTRQVTLSPEWIATVLPVRDGLLVALRVDP